MAKTKVVADETAAKSKRTSQAGAMAGTAVKAPKKAAPAKITVAENNVAERTGTEKAAAEKPRTGRSRVVIESVTPQVDCGRFFAKRVVGDEVVVEADVFGDGHDLVRARVLYRHESETAWTAVEMLALGNDHWQAAFPVARLGFYRFTVVGEIDHFGTWRYELKKRLDAGQELELPLKMGAALIEATASRIGKDGAEAEKDVQRLRTFARDLLSDLPNGAATVTAFDATLLELMQRYPDTSLETRYERELKIWVDRERGRFSSWYELFPRSWGETGQHGTLRDVADRLAYVAEMGFDVLYLPPIHPVGRSFRKGKNNTMEAKPDDSGSPWAIGSAEGGHTSILPELGTFADLAYLIAELKARGMELALDIAFQCAPDHPWVSEHPEWFKKRPDGSIQYAENPPKKYQDIYPLDFESSDWEGLWAELKHVFMFWAQKDVRIFRVDNPHTKAFPFWEWVIAEVQRTYPDVIFLAEAFTRPRVMERLAKLGFTQSYTYFTWRTTKAELETYMRELTQTPVREYMRPNFWPNTPDILPLGLQTGGLPAFRSRLVLATTLCSNFGIYGPAFELGENTPFKPGSEEYLNSEKYEIKQWDLDRPNSLRPLITRLNRVRGEHPALQRNERLVFHAADNADLIAYSKTSADGADAVLTIVNLDPFNPQSGWVTLDGYALGLSAGEVYEVYDLLADRGYTWTGARNYVELRPLEAPAHVFEIRRRR